jgi:hypothetical protein
MPAIWEGGGIRAATHCCKPVNIGKFCGRLNADAYGREAELRGCSTDASILQSADEVGLLMQSRRVLQIVGVGPLQSSEGGEREAKSARPAHV